MLDASRGVEYHPSPLSEGDRYHRDTIRWTLGPLVVTAGTRCSQTAVSYLYCSLPAPPVRLKSGTNDQTSNSDSDPLIARKLLDREMATRIAVGNCSQTNVQDKRLSLDVVTRPPFSSQPTARPVEMGLHSAVVLFPQSPRSTAVSIPLAVARVAPGAAGSAMKSEYAALDAANSRARRRSMPL